MITHLLSSIKENQFIYVVTEECSEVDIFRMIEDTMDETIGNLYVLFLINCEVGCNSFVILHLC